MSSLGIRQESFAPNNATQRIAPPCAAFCFTRGMKELFHEILFLGQPSDLECLLVHLKSLDVEEWQDLCLALESLRYFRAHYQDPKAKLPESARAKVARYDADWTMQILAMIDA